jgi:dCMP deaminase
MKNESMNKWDKRFFDMCDLVSSWSEDASRKVGAVIVGPNNEVRSIGYNGLPRGIRGDIPRRHDRLENEKYYWFEHAERNAIYNAARSGIPVAGCRIYASLFPCADCARAIIQSGISQLYSYSHPENDTTFEKSFSIATEMLAEAGLEVRLFAPDLSRRT